MARLCCAGSKTKSIEFKLSAPQAKRVSVGGTFNAWSTKGNSAKKDSSGNWTAKVELMPGKYEYKFFVDGMWMNDPRCSHLVTNSFGTQNCVIEVK
jgi:1,4-alpha-glucan branching enzyme